MKTIKSRINNPRFHYTFPQKKEQIAFFDIETTGLSPKASSLYLIGAIYYDSAEGSWILLQWFADNYQSEKPILQSFLDFLENFDFLYHFNGKTFDVPYILHKCQRHAISVSQHNAGILEDTTDNRSIDLLKHVRSLRHALMLDKCNQTALERWLGIQRTDIFSGGDLIPVYSEYMQQRILAPEKARELEKVLLLHNHDDLEMMLEICSILSYEEYLLHPEGNPVFQPDALSRAKIDVKQDSITITLPITETVPRKVTLCACYPKTSLSSLESRENMALSLPTAALTLDKTVCTLTLPLYQGVLKYFYANPKDYFYLPEEDMAVHKSIAEFVEKDFRQKATAATCYTKTEGRFLPSLTPYVRRKKTEEAPGELPHFFIEYKDKLSFLQLPENFTENTDFWQKFLPGEFHGFL